MKQISAFLIALLLAISLVPTSFAASSEALEAAETLYNLGLFNGVGTDANGNPIYDLDRAPTRQEAVTMLVRLLGKESSANRETWELPFSDVANWAKPYVGYAYSRGLTSGTSATTFSGNSTITTSQYLTLILRVLEYQSGKDFQWDKAWILSDKIGLTHGEYTNNTESFTRGDIAIISKNALSCNLKNSTLTLADILPATSRLPIESTDNAPPQAKLKILNYLERASELSAKAYQYGNYCTFFLSQGGYNSSIYNYAKQSQKHFDSANLAFIMAMYECANYADTQSLRSNFETISTHFFTFTSYPLTDTRDSILEYISLISDVDSDRVAMESIYNIIDKW